MSDMPSPSEPDPSAPGDTLILTQADPATLLHEIADLERECRNAEDDVTAAKATLKGRQEILADRVAAMRRKCREIDAPPMPLFAEMPAPGDEAP